MADVPSADSALTDLAPAPTLALHTVGEEAEPVLVVDGLMRRPQALVELAAERAEFQPASAFGSGYPGLLAAAPLDYVGAVVGRLRPWLEKAFGVHDAQPSRAQCNFSLVTLSPEALSPPQRLPHVDTADPLQFAILHFLCGPEFGGTAFFRHRSTGFETLTPERDATYRTTLDTELARTPPASTYVTGDTPLFAQTGAFNARFDRVLVYRSRVLHSGVIPPGPPPPADPRRGRLTANIFLNYRRR